MPRSDPPTVIQPLSHSFISVSYTHLDVYRDRFKQLHLLTFRYVIRPCHDNRVLIRESLLHHDLIIPEQLPDLHGPASHRLRLRVIHPNTRLVRGRILEPVSYTHLDVYKRQA